ncbi:MAG: DUF1003 domain-containing protein [Aeromicrobium sp.]|nr:DUF1003 domain-containing protein [Burkholderiales bacterium]
MNTRMKASPEVSANATPPTPPKPATPQAAENEQIRQNINAVLDFYNRADEQISYWQRLLERVSHIVGQPFFFGLILVFVLVWASVNLLMRYLGIPEFDPAPFFWLQGIMGLAALLTTTIVLTRQNRLAKLEEQRAHLDLKVTLLTEQKAAKLIDLLEELRRDLPNVKNRDDPEAVVLQQSMNPDLVLAALDERAAPETTSSPASPAASSPASSATPESDSPSDKPASAA